MYAEKNLLLAGIKHATGHVKIASTILAAEQKKVNSPEHLVARQHEFDELKEAQQGEYCVDEEFNATIINAMVGLRLHVLC